MKVLYALFQEPGVAETALRALKSSGLTEDECRVFVHKDKPSPALRTSESDTRHGLLIGLISGAVGGALMGWLLTGPLGLLRLPERLPERQQQCLNHQPHPQPQLQQQRPWQSCCPAQLLSPTAWVTEQRCCQQQQTRQPKGLSYITH